MRRTRIIYGTAAAVVVGVLGLAVYEDQQGEDSPTAFDTTSAAEYIAQDRWGRLGDMYREVVPNATDDQIEQWEADAAEYEAQVAEADECELDAQADMDAAAGGYDLDNDPDGLQAEADAAFDRWLDASGLPGEPEYDRLEREAEEAQDAADAAQDDLDGEYNAAVDRSNACDASVDRSLVEDHPLYEVDGDTVTYYGP